MKGEESINTSDQLLCAHWKLLGRSHELNIYLINCLAIPQPILRIKLIYFRIQEMQRFNQLKMSQIEWTCIVQLREQS